MQTNIFNAIIQGLGTIGEASTSEVLLIVAVAILGFIVLKLLCDIFGRFL